MKKYLTVLACILCLPAYTKDAAQENVFDKDIFQWSKTFAEVIDLIHQKYYQEVDAKQAMLKAMDAFANLDPHSHLLDPKTYQEIISTTMGEFSGIGIIIDALKEPEDEALRVIDTTPAGPSDKAGLIAEDKIVEIEGESLKGMTVEEAIARLKGKKGSTVHVKVLRKDHPKLISFDIVRDTVETQNALCYYFKEHNIHYLALTMFAEKSMEQLQALLEKSQQNDSKGLILDLRNNSGGLLTSVIDIAGLFLEKDSLVVVTKDRNQNVTEEFRTRRAPLANNTPIFILINNYTASAAEILAGCLKLHCQDPKKEMPHVFLVGTTTFGKGSVQEVIPISNDAALKMTTSLYYLPGDISIQGNGIAADFEIEQKLPPSDEVRWFNKFFGRESSLKKSIKNEHTTPAEQEKKNEQTEPQQKPKEKTWHERKQEQISADYQILSTIRLIEMLDLGRTAFADQINTHAQAKKFLQCRYNPNDTLTIEEIKM